MPADPPPNTAANARRMVFIPLLVAALIVAIIGAFARLSAGPASLEEAMARLKRADDPRQRYVDAAAVAASLNGPVTPAERESLAQGLIEILDRHAGVADSQVVSLLLLSLGRAAQCDAGEPVRQQAAAAILRHCDAPADASAGIPVSARFAVRKAAILALACMGHGPATRGAMPQLLAKLRDASEDIDVRMAAAAAMGTIAQADDADVIAALRASLCDDDPRRIEIAWNAALSLARLGDRSGIAFVAKLADESYLRNVQIYDREGPAEAPHPRPLNEEEIRRVLTNARACRGETS